MVLRRVASSGGTSLKHPSRLASQVPLRALGDFYGFHEILRDVLLSQHGRDDFVPLQRHEIVARASNV